MIQRELTEIIAPDEPQLHRDPMDFESARQRILDHIENLPLAIIEWTPELRVERWSSRASEMFGWTAEEVMGRHFSQWPFVHPDDVQVVECVVSRLLSGEESRNISRNRNLTKSGGTVHCVWHNSVLRGIDGEIVSILSFVQDATDQARAEESAQRANSERRALENKLQEGQKLESLGLLAGGIAHDFNNLLTSVLGNASLAAMEVTPGSSVAKCLEQIELSAMRAAELCQQMLAYAGKGHFIVRRVDLNQLITETTSLIHASISKTASLGLNLAPMLPAVLADEAQIRQVIMNLVINASEALGERGGTIRVSTGVMKVSRNWLQRAHLAPELPEGEYVYVEVADTGSGMTPDVKSRVFDPFFTTKFTGRGLGLAAVLGIVRGHGGAIQVDSELNRGTTIRVIFPTVVEASETSSRGVTSATPWRGSGTVLVIDDEETVRRVTSRMLKAMGFDVELAVDGADGLHQFQAIGSKVRLVLLDLTMPRLGGEGAFQEIHRMNPEMPVILMSGFNEQEVASHFNSRGLAGFLQKPFSLGALEKKLREVLEA
jgi:PAS domain S-box-containing protein